MTHPTLQPLFVLLEQAEQARDEIVAQQARAEQAHAAAQAQQDQLRGYRQDYQRRWQQQFTQGVGIALATCYHDFAGRLNGVVDLQAEQVVRAAQAMDELRERRLAAELRVASVRKLIERREALLLAQGERRDQKRADELASRMAWQRLQQGHAFDVA
ncbi:flagellar export protein FliJ [Leptothrix discophora]|uniref:Flagellar FliJ protein n=1 Tax=Leptothrix discophora TaxID=89 RepID=A0ABT9G6M2_LEPDI|nr:flagellar FliJ family protein [Leptothrix discophora]MDP4302051.1 flagellar FliJ family protein [Leptothrix discophora]